MSLKYTTVQYYIYVYYMVTIILYNYIHQKKCIIINKMSTIHLPEEVYGEGGCPGRCSRGMKEREKQRATTMSMVPACSLVGYSRVTTDCSRFSCCNNRLFSVRNRPTCWVNCWFACVLISTLSSKPSTYSFFLFRLSCADNLFLILRRTRFRCFCSCYR